MGARLDLASSAATVAVELILFAIGFSIYLMTTRAKDAVGSYSLTALVVFTLLLYFGNVFGPPPKDVTALAWFGLCQWLYLTWLCWIDRHRMVLKQ